MRTVFAKFRKYKKYIQGAVEACMKAAEDKKLEILGGSWEIQVCENQRQC